MEEITIYKFQLESIKEVLRIAANLLDSRRKDKTDRTCFDRMLCQAEQYSKNALDGKKDEIALYI